MEISHSVAAKPFIRFQPLKCLITGLVIINHSDPFRQDHFVTKYVTKKTSMTYLPTYTMESFLKKFHFVSADILQLILCKIPSFHLMPFWSEGNFKVFSADV